MHHRSPLPPVPGLPQEHPRKAGDEQRRSRREGKRGDTFYGDTFYGYTFYGDKPNL